MGTPRDEAFWKLKEDKADEAGAAEWQHPGEMIDAAAAAKLFEGQDVGQLFKRLLILCLPPPGYGKTRRMEVGYRRMCIIVFELAPELFNGMDKKALAKYLGLTYRGLLMEFDQVRAMLDARRQGKR